MKFRSKNQWRWLLAISILLMSNFSHGAIYYCEVASQTVFESNQNVKLLAKEEILKRKPHLIIEDENEKHIQRCSYVTSLKDFTCDRYRVDHVSVDTKVNLKKFYLLNAQFDAQVFSDLTFIENNGRGSISYGACKIIRP